MLRKRLIGAGPWLLPPLYLGLILWLQPPLRLGDPEVLTWPGRLLYDDYDPMARALRGLNAKLGRTAGLPQEPRSLKPDEFATELTRQGKPQEEAYFLEYPHTALWLFRAGYGFGNDIEDSAVPPAVRDAYFLNVVEHYPRSEREQRLWTHFRRAIQIYACFGALCLVALMLVLRAGYEPGQGAGSDLWLLVLPAALYFSLNRFDVVPALLTALSLACLGRRRIWWSGAFLAAAAMVKVYPILLAPLFFRFLSGERSSAWRWSGAFLATVAALLAPALGQFGWHATWAPYRFQLARDWEGWSIYGYLLPPFLAHADLSGRLFRTGTLLLTVLLLCWHRPRDLSCLLRRSAAVLIVFVSLQVFYSPQWIIWFNPFLVPLASKVRFLRPLLVALDIITFLSFPVVYDLPNSWIELTLRTLLIYARFAVLGFLVFILLRNESALPPRKRAADFLS